MLPPKPRRRPNLLSPSPLRIISPRKLSHRRPPSQRPSQLRLQSRQNRHPSLRRKSPSQLSTVASTTTATTLRSRWNRAKMTLTQRIIRRQLSSNRSRPARLNTSPRESPQPTKRLLSRLKSKRARSCRATSTRRPRLRLRRESQLSRSSLSRSRSLRARRKRVPRLLPRPPLP